MTLQAIAFYVFSVLALLGALAVVVPPFGRNPLHAALALLFVLLCVAGVYGVLAAHFLLVLQILVYADAVIVLFAFVVLLLNLRKEELVGARVTPWKVCGVAALVVFLWKTGLGLYAAVAPHTRAGLPPEGYGGVAKVSEALVKGYLVPFEVSSLLLLVAILGAVLIARKGKG